MTEETLPATRAQLSASGAPVSAIIPQDIDQMYRLAIAMFKSGWIPSTHKSAEQVMVAIMAGAEVGMPPFQSVQSFAVINGRPCLWGDGLLAVVRTNGFRVREWPEGEGDGLVAHCEVTRPDTGETIHRKFSVADAKRANLWGKVGPWQQYGPRMLAMRARGFALRDGAADVLRGFQIREEVEDYQDARVDVVDQPKTSGLAARLADQRPDPASAPQPGFDAANVAKETGGEGKPRGRPRKAATVEPSNDTGQSAEAPTASAVAAETPHDQNTGEIVDAVVEEIGDGQKLTDAATDGNQLTDAPSDDFPGDRKPEGEQSGAEPTEHSDGSDDSAQDDAPYTEMAEAMTGAPHWLAIKQVLKGYGKTDAWKVDEFRHRSFQAAWRRFSDLKNGGEEDTAVASDITLFQLWLGEGAKTVEQVETFSRAFFKQAGKNLAGPDKEKIDALIVAAKERLAG